MVCGCAVGMMALLQKSKDSTNTFQNKYILLIIKNSSGTSMHSKYKHKLVFLEWDVLETGLHRVAQYLSTHQPCGFFYIFPASPLMEIWALLNFSLARPHAWSLIPNFTLILVYVLWRISWLLITFQHVCACLKVTGSERQLSAPFQLHL